MDPDAVQVAPEVEVANHPTAAAEMVKPVESTAAEELAPVDNAGNPEVAKPKETVEGVDASAAGGSAVFENSVKSEVTAVAGVAETVDRVETSAAEESAAIESAPALEGAVVKPTDPVGHVESVTPRESAAPEEHEVSKERAAPEESTAPDGTVAPKETETPEEVVASEESATPEMKSARAEANATATPETVPSMPAPSVIESTTALSSTAVSSTRSTIEMASPAHEPISIGRRMCVTTGLTIFGLVFFYLVMVALSTVSKNIVMARIPHHGWARTASRHTGSVSTVVFALFLLSDKSAMNSLTMAVFLACAQFCHFVIVSSDARAYVDEEILMQMTRMEKTHTLLGMLPLWSMPVLGTVGFFACLAIVNERVLGPALRDGKPELPFISRISVGWLLGLYSLYYVDNFIWAVVKGNSEVGDVVYPLLFLSLLFVSAAYPRAKKAPLAPQSQERDLLSKKNQ